MPFSQKPIATFELDSYQPLFEEALKDLEKNQIISRLGAHDHTIWKPDPQEITNRLGWLEIQRNMISQVDNLKLFAEEVRNLGYEQCVLLGMGGSSLAPEVFSKTFGTQSGYLDLKVLDSTDPRSISTIRANLNIEKTLFIVSTKSGTTVETLSLFRYFYNQVLDTCKSKNVGKQFVAITDPGTKLEEIARNHNFFRIFRNNPDIGGRYSALSFVGLVPASLLGIDIKLLLGRAIQAAASYGVGNLVANPGNPGVNLGAALGVLALHGRDKLSLVLSPEIASFGAWIEQLIAESTGKEKKGILPVIGDRPSDLRNFRTDRCFVCLQLENDWAMNDQIDVLLSNQQPTIILKLADRYDLGTQIFLWEFATAVAGHFLGINPFNQPDVESAKSNSRKYVDDYKRSGQLTYPNPDLSTPGFDIYLPPGIHHQQISKTNPVGSTMNQLFKLAQPGAYVAIQAYLPPTEEISASLNEFRIMIRDHTGLATTFGYGPRFLHSTGQLHKGDAGRGLFIQLTSQSEQDILIPDEAGKDKSSIGFGVLEVAQALGDSLALTNASRSLLRIHLKQEVQVGITQLIRSLT